MIRWKNIILIMIALCFSYSCSSAKVSRSILSPDSKPLPETATITEPLPVKSETKLSTNINKENLIQQLDLSPQQQKQMEKVRHQYQKEIHQKQHNLKLLQQQFSQMMTGTDSVKLIRLKNQELVQLRQEIGNLRFESMLATRELLTPQQRQKFRDLTQP